MWKKKTFDLIVIILTLIDFYFTSVIVCPSIYFKDYLTNADAMYLRLYNCQQRKIILEMKK